MAQSTFKLVGYDIVPGENGQQIIRIIVYPGGKKLEMNRVTPQGNTEIIDLRTLRVFDSHMRTLFSVRVSRDDASPFRQGTLSFPQDLPVMLVGLSGETVAGETELVPPTYKEAAEVLAKLNCGLDVDLTKVSADEKNRLPEYKIGMKGLALLSKIDFNQLPGKKAFIEKLQRPENATYSPVNEVGKNPTIREELNTDNTFQEGLTLEEWAEQNPKHFLTRGMQA